MATRLEQLDAKLAALKLERAQELSAEAQRARKDDTRVKILLAGELLAAVGREDADARKVLVALGTRLRGSETQSTRDVLERWIGARGSAYAIHMPPPPLPPLSVLSVLSDADDLGKTDDDTSGQPGDDGTDEGTS